MSELRNTLGAKKFKPQDWIEKVYGRLTVRSILRREGPKNTLVVLCDCSCGKTHECRVTSLGEGTQSCGCLRDEVNSMPTIERPPRRKKYAVSDAQKEAIRLRKIAWVKANPDKVAAIARRCREKHPEKLKVEKAKEYQRRKTSVIEKLNKRYAEDERFRVESLIRSRIRKIVAQRGAIKSAKSMDLLGCSIEFFMLYIESLFLPGMSWENRELFHLDHIRPCADFDLTDPDQQKICFNYKNMQPLWAEDNLAKKARLDWTPAESKRITSPPAPSTQESESRGPQAST